MKRHTSGFSPLLLLIKLNINIGLLIEAKKRIYPPLYQVPKELNDIIANHFLFSNRLYLPSHILRNLQKHVI